MAAPTPSAAKTIVVADATKFVCDRFQAALEGAGHRAISVRTRGELLAHVSSAAGEVDLIVLDLRLQQSRGVELVQRLRRIDGLDAPIVVFSGTIANADEVKALAALGVAGYVNEYTAVQHIVPSLAPYLFPDRYNRRSSPRVAVGVPVSYRFGNTIATALTVNVSQGGIGVRTTSPLDEGVHVKVRFRLPGGKRDIEAGAQVAWSQRRVGMGLQFTTMEAADQALIDDFVNAHFFTNRKA